MSERRQRRATDAPKPWWQSKSVWGAILGPLLALAADQAPEPWRRYALTATLILGSLGVIHARQQPGTITLKPTARKPKEPTV